MQNGSVKNASVKSYMKKTCSARTRRGAMECEVNPSAVLVLVYGFPSVRFSPWLVSASQVYLSHWDLSAEALSSTTASKAQSSINMHHRKCLCNDGLRPKFFCCELLCKDVNLGYCHTVRRRLVKCV